MRYVVVLAVSAYLYAQSGCGPCTANNTLPPKTFDPPFLTISVGRDTEVVVQFALPETVSAPSPINYVYPNFAIWVDSLRMKHGNMYVSLRGQPSVAPAYNTANPSQGALRFDQDHRYKQVRSNPNAYAYVVVYQNPGGGSPSSPTPPRGCVRACIRGVQVGTDTLMIYLRGFVDPNSINLFPGQSNDINNKDTTNLMPTLAGQPLYSDVWTEYEVRVTGSPTSIQAGVLGEVSVAPNPAWGQATLHYTLHRSSDLTVRVLALSGAEVQTYKLGGRPAGEYTLDLALPAGVYLIQVEAGQERLLQKLVVL